MVQRNTRQRQAILNQLRGRTDHPTAQTLYAELKHAWPSLSLGTVYSNLAYLCKNGQALKVPCGSGADRYDGTTARHYHMICLHCGGVCDVTNLVVSLRGAEGFAGEIQGFDIQFKGICPACKKKGRAAETTETPQGSEYIQHCEGEES